jgi:hypothetical protein
MKPSTLPDTSVDFALLRELFGRLIEVQAGNPVAPDDRWKNHAQVLLIKVFRHLESIETIFKGVSTSLEGKFYPHYVDHASIAVLVRAAFETYMMFHFIFCAKTPELRQLRYKVWEYVGLRERQALHGTVLTKAQWQHVVSTDNRRIQALDKEIRADGLFAQYTKDIKDKVLKKNDVKMGLRWMDLAEESGFPRKYAHDMYSHFCNYAHSGFVSVLQIRDAAQAGDYKQLASVAISFCALLMGQIIDNYARLFSPVNQALQNDSEALALLGRWQALLGRLGTLYGAEAQRSPKDKIEQHRN